MPLKEYAPGTICWGKLKGYPWWPSRIETESSLSKEVLSSKPRTGQTYPVLFLGSLDYAWLTPENIEEYKENSAKYAGRAKNRKDPDFSKALKQAENPSLLDDIEIGGCSDAYSDEENGDEGVEVQKTPRRRGRKPKPKGKRTTENALMDVETASQNSEPSAKRAKTSSDDKGSANNGRRRSSHASKEEEEEEDRPMRSESRKAINSERSASPDVANGAEVNSNHGSSENNRRRSRKKYDKDHENDLRTRMKELGKPFETLMLLRYKIQKRLRKGAIPKDLSILDDTFSKIEEFDMTRELLQETKMGKLMQRVNTLGDLPNHPDNIKYKFVERAEALLAKWKTKISEQQKADNHDSNTNEGSTGYNEATRSSSVQKSESSDDQDHKPDTSSPTSQKAEEKLNGKGGDENNVSSTNDENKVSTKPVDPKPNPEIPQPTATISEKLQS
ncbi:hypothetical protein H4219_000687 [Mycoemilia scoparia]|uniref:PWWP domain-containing protein n=1 Tax=Mycoemilia scoparia TaxID=417184 RepID=A0A9W8A2E1_9FUNG|nr:hypothetical protein H4219_000687 [Mycoemilia scoparia]